MPEQLTGWKVKVWALGHGTKRRPGRGRKSRRRRTFSLRLQAPRFFTQKDEVVLSANVHNYLKSREVRSPSPSRSRAASSRSSAATATQDIKVAAGGERRVDWRVKVTGEGIGPSSA